MNVLWTSIGYSKVALFVQLHATIKTYVDELSGLYNPAFGWLVEN